MKIRFQNLFFSERLFGLYYLNNLKGYGSKDENNDDPIKDHHSIDNSPINLFSIKIKQNFTYIFKLFIETASISLTIFDHNLWSQFCCTIPCKEIKAKKDSASTIIKSIQLNIKIQFKICSDSELLNLSWESENKKNRSRQLYKLKKDTR